jgi:GT2 family glycosyltransferase
LHGEEALNSGDPAVTFAVVSWNTRELLERCLRSLEDDARAGRAAVWVVDNASDDGSADMVDEHFAWATLVRCDENLGFGRAVNLVAERTQGEWLATANDDVVLAPDALPRLLGAAAPGVGAVVPRLVLPDGSTQHSVYAFPSPLVAAVTELGLRGRIGERLCLLGAWDPERPRAVPWAMAAFALFRREAFDAAGGFEPGQWMYAEDLSLGWRLREAGWETRYEPSARVEHRGGEATGAAFGDERTQRRMEATYEWMARARGPGRTRATAGIAWAAHTLRAVVRRGPARDRARYWRAIHARGLRR